MLIPEHGLFDRYGHGAVFESLPYRPATITTSRQINGILEFLAAGACLLCGNWKIRREENARKLDAAVMKALLLQQRAKELPFSEKRWSGRVACW